MTIIDETDHAQMRFRQEYAASAPCAIDTISDAALLMPPLIRCYSVDADDFVHMMLRLFYTDARACHGVIVHMMLR